MKKNKMFLVVMVALLTLMLISCDKDPVLEPEVLVVVGDDGIIVEDNAWREEIISEPVERSVNELIYETIDITLQMMKLCSWQVVGTAMITNDTDTPVWVPFSMAVEQEALTLSIGWLGEDMRIAVRGEEAFLVDDTSKRFTSMDWADALPFIALTKFPTDDLLHYGSGVGNFGGTLSFFETFLDYDGVQVSFFVAMESDDLSIIGVRMVDISTVVELKFDSLTYPADEGFLYIPLDYEAIYFEDGILSKLLWGLDVREVEE